MAITANANDEIIPDFRTLLVFEATQYGNAGSAVWQVQMWRVTLFNGFRQRLARVPVASSI